MKHIIFLFVLLIFGCSEDALIVQSNIYPEDPFFRLQPYPLIQINASDPIVGTFRPGYPANKIQVNGYHTSAPENVVFSVEFLDTLSAADMVPGDNVFRFFLSRSLFPISNDFTITVDAIRDGNQVWSDSLSNIETVANTAPKITSLVIGDSLNPDTLSWKWVISVFDPDPGDQITIDAYAEYAAGWVHIGNWSDDGSGDDMVPGDGIVQAAFDSTSRVGLQGDVNFKFVATDLTSNTDETIAKMTVENNPPEIVDLAIPDTLIIRPLSSQSLFSIKVSDTETIADIDSVIALFYDFNGAFKAKADQFNDDGLNGDVTANDGWYSTGVVNPTDPSAEGQWTLKIYSVDKINNKSDLIIHPLYLRNE